VPNCYFPLSKHETSAYRELDKLREAASLSGQVTSCSTSRDASAALNGSISCLD
jgi:hypothetical protein